MPSVGEIVIEPFIDDQEAMNEIAAFHLSVRQWQVDTGQNAFTDINSSQEDLTLLGQSI